MISGLIKDFGAGVRDAYVYLYQREEKVRPVSTPTAKILHVIEAPLRGCQWVANRMADATLPCIKPLGRFTPNWIRNRYTRYTEGRVDLYMEKLPLNHPAVQKVREGIRSAIWDLAALYLPETFLGLAGSAAIKARDAFAGLCLKGLRKRVGRTIQAVHALAANEAAKQCLAFIYGLGLQYALYACLNHYAKNYVSAHTGLNSSLRYIQYGLMGYIYGPTVYKTGKFAVGCWDAKKRAEETIQLFASDKVKERVGKVAEKLNLTSDSLLKMTSLFLLEAKLEFLVPYLSDTEALFETIAEGLGKKKIQANTNHEK